MKNAKGTIILFAVLLAVIPSVFAASMSSPVTGGNYSTTLTITVTADMNNITNVTCYYNASNGPANVSAVKLASIINTTADQTVFTTTTSITARTDATTYNVSCEILNGTTLNKTLSASSITFDSTNPTCTLTKDHKSLAYKGIQELIWTSEDALSLISTAVTIDRPEDGADLTYTDASRTLQLLSQDTKYVGSWTATVLSTDRAANTATCTETWKTYLPNGETAEVSTTTSSNNKIIWIIVICIVAWLIFGKKK